MELWRQGDILIQKINTIPNKVKEKKPPVIASSDTTGHSHKIKNPKTAHLYYYKSQTKYWDESGERFLEVIANFAELIHPEHRKIVLSKGKYRLWKQREYTPQGNRWVYD